MFCMVVSLAPNPVFRSVSLVGLFPLGVGLAGGVDFGGFRMISNEIVKGEIYEGLGIYDDMGWGVILV